MRFLLIVALAAATLLPTVSASALWEENGINISTTPGASEYAPRMVSDGSGGAIVAWSWENMVIRAQRIDAYGNALWSPGGVLICAGTDYRSQVQLASDGAGGAIIAWLDQRNLNIDIYAQRIDPDGNVLWTPGGVTVCTMSTTEQDHRIISDGAGGAIIAWRDYRSGNSDIYAQRLDASGATQWTLNGIVACNAGGDQNDIQLMAKGTGGAFVVWTDSRSLYWDIFYQIIYADGSTLYDTGARQLTNTPGNDGYPTIASDGIGGAIIAWTNWNVGGGDIYAQRINYGGYNAWIDGGIPVCAAASLQTGAAAVSDGAYGAIIVWTDYRYSPTMDELYGQRVDANGNPLWAADGIAINPGISGVSVPEIVSDGRGGAILLWEDYRYGDQDLFCQRLNGNGATLWGMSGVAVAVAESYQSQAAMICDGEAGAIAAWFDFRPSATTEIYAQRIERSGFWGYPSPTIANIRDVPGDQGGFVDLAWSASRLDDWFNPLVQYYTIWRAISHEGALALEANGIALVEDPSEIDPTSKTPVIRTEQVGADTYYWQLIYNVYAYYLEAYSQTVPTLFDSTGASTELHYFQVIAHGNYQGQFWASPPASGYSVDNLEPAPPEGLAGEQEYTPAGLSISWDSNREADLGGYAVYRGLSSDFVPSPANRVAVPPDTLWFDSEWRWDSGYYYKVSALDIHGNESGFALLAPDNVTGSEAPTAPEATFLAQNYPNPFNPTTRISYGLAAPARVSLRIYDPAGRLVRVLVEGDRPAGSYGAIWDGRDSSGRAVASGIYFYRLEAGAFTQTRKMAILR